MSALRKRRWTSTTVICAAQAALMASGCASVMPLTVAGPAKDRPDATPGSLTARHLQSCPICHTTLDAKGHHMLAAQAERVLDKLTGDVATSVLPASKRTAYQAFVPKAAAKLNLPALVHTRSPGGRFKLASLGNQAEVAAFVAQSARYVACATPEPTPDPTAAPTDPPADTPVDTSTPPPDVPVDTSTPPPDEPVDTSTPPPDVPIDYPTEPPPVDPYVEPPPEPEPEPIPEPIDPSLEGLCCPVDDYI